MQIVLAEEDGIENVLFAAFEGLVLHLDDSVSVIADVVEGGDEFAPVYIAEAGDLRAHIVERKFEDEMISKSLFPVIFFPP